MKLGTIQDFELYTNSLREAREESEREIIDKLSQIKINPEPKSEGEEEKQKANEQSLKEIHDSDIEKTYKDLAENIGIGNFSE